MVAPLRLLMRVSVPAVPIVSHTPTHLSVLLSLDHHSQFLPLLNDCLVIFLYLYLDLLIA
jgi:hypothetical protein